jgi:hypothetical protein
MALVIEDYGGPRQRWKLESEGVGDNGARLYVCSERAAATMLTITYCYNIFIIPLSIGHIDPYLHLVFRLKHT